MIMQCVTRHTQAMIAIIGIGSIQIIRKDKTSSRFEWQAPVI